MELLWLIFDMVGTIAFAVSGTLVGKSIITGIPVKIDDTAANSYIRYSNIEDVSFFVTNVIEKKEKEEVETVLFKERSYGIFENKATDENIFKRFEKTLRCSKHP